MALYPALKANQLVGTDLVQAVPLVVSAAVAHLWFGEVDWSVTIPVIIGSIPGTYLGAQLSSRVGGGGLVRRALAIVLLVSGLKMLGASNELTLAALATALIGGTLAWALIRHRLGFDFFIWQAKRHEAEQATLCDRAPRSSHPHTVTSNRARTLKTLRNHTAPLVPQASVPATQTVHGTIEPARAEADD